jgi:hypothetical protein
MRVAEDVDKPIVRQPSARKILLTFATQRSVALGLRWKKRRTFGVS